MEYRDLYFMDIYPECDNVEWCSIECPECKEWSHHQDWKEAESYCEDCWSHMATKCPKCENVFDCVFTKFQCKK